MTTQRWRQIERKRDYEFEHPKFVCKKTKVQTKVATIQTMLSSVEGECAKVCDPVFEKEKNEYIKRKMENNENLIVGNSNLHHNNNKRNPFEKHVRFSNTPTCHVGA